MERRRRRLSLETRLGVVTCLVLVVVATTLFIELTARNRIELLSAKATAATMLTELLANELAPAVDFGDLDDILDSLNYLRANRDIVGASVWPHDASRPMAHWAAAGAPTEAMPSPGEPDGTTTSSDWLVATKTVYGQRIGQRNTPLARVRVVFTLQPENEAFRSNRWRLFWMTSGLSAGTAILLGLLARRYVVGPLKRMSLAASALAHGVQSARVEAPADDEIGDLARAFNSMGEAVRFREEQLHKEIELAKRIQTSILPQSLAVPGLELAAKMIPAAQVGGDYYDVLRSDRGCWIGIGDVAGHGLDAGLIMLMTQATLATLVKSNSAATPSDVVCILNEVLFDNIRGRLRREHHVTLTVLHYDESGDVVFAGAHEDIVIFRGTERRCELVSTPGTWVGGRKDIRPGTVDSRLRLIPGDIMVLYTDGVTEMRNSEGEPFGIERLCAELEKAYDEPVATIQDRLFLAVAGWGTPDDDVTIMVAKYVGVAPKAVSVGGS